jgi:hypothetical protein
VTRSRFARILCAGLGACCVALAAHAASERGNTWASLTPAQQQALAPLQHEWAALEPNRRAKWLELSTRFPTMPAEERQRVQQRMTEWVRLTPAERTRARMQFQEVRQLPAEERQAKWQAYQALSEEERSQLAARSKHAAKAPGASASASTESHQVGAADASAPRKGAASTPNRAVAPIVVQAHPGATTSTMTPQVVKPQALPRGVPKIAATPGYVDPATLLPKHGPQGTSGGDSADQN